jgi:hypothetical protein
MAKIIATGAELCLSLAYSVNTTHTTIAHLSRDSRRKYDKIISK